MGFRQAIVIAAKSKTESRTRAAADTARAETASTRKSIATPAQVAEAERGKRISLIEADRQATGIRVQAKTERDAAADRAASIREIADAEADQITIKAAAKAGGELFNIDHEGLDPNGQP